MLYSQSQKDSIGLGYGFLGVLIFSLTLPATRLAVAELDPVFIGLGRAVLAAGLSLILVVVTRQTIPPWRFFPRFVVVVAGVIIGFPLLSASAMRDAPASYGAVIVGLLPLATAFFGVWRGGEQVSKSFWIFALIGSGLIISFALMSGAGSMMAMSQSLKNNRKLLKNRPNTRYEHFDRSQTRDAIGAKEAPIYKKASREYLAALREQLSRDKKKEVIRKAVAAAAAVALVGLGMAYLLLS